MRLLALRVCIMANRKASFIAAILGFLAALAFLILYSMKSGVSLKSHQQTRNGGNTHVSRENDSDRTPHPKRTRHDDTDAKALREMEKEFDELLPAQFPEQFSSICDVTLEPGESLILGGFKKSDGNYEFTMITVDPNVSGELKGQYTTTAKTMVLSPERSSQLGFDALVSLARTRIQKGLVLDTETIIRSISSGHYVGFMTSPSITNPANRSASIDLGYGEGSLVITALVTRDGEGGSIRLRTRIESPDDSLWVPKSR